MTTREELIERVGQLIDDEVFTRTGRSVGDLASGHVARVLADAGVLDDADTAAELERVQAELTVARTPHGASYVDPEHQGGNCVDTIMNLAAELAQARKNWRAAREANMTALETIATLKARLTFGLKLIDDQVALFGSVMAESQAGILRDVRAALTGEATLDD